MKKIIDALIAAFEYISGSKARVTALLAEIAERDAIITDLRDKLAAEDLDDEELEARVAEAESSLATLRAEIDEANVKADELAAAISSDEDIPVVVEDGVATPQ